LRQRGAAMASGKVNVSKQIDLMDSCLSDMRTICDAFESQVTRLERMSAAERRENAIEHSNWRDANQRRFNAQETTMVKSLAKVERVDPKTAARYGTRKREVKSKFNEVLAAFNSLGVSKDASAARSAAMFAGRTKQMDLDRSAGNDAHISATAAILKETHADAEAGVKQLAEVHGVIQAANAKVQEDNDELKRVELTLKEIDSETELAGKVVRNMLKRVYTDKILLVFIALVVLGVAGIIIYSSLVPDNDFNVPDVAKPPTPECVQIMANGGTC